MAIVGEAIAAAGFVGAELFNYNRKNFEFDNDQRFEREELRLKMQVERFKLFREDIRDLVELTVGKMDLYHLIGALFLKGCVLFFCKGIIHGEVPPYLLILFYLSTASSFVYLLLAVWLSMNASISSHSYGTRLLTRFVRLPIPSSAQMAVMNAKYADFERQGGGAMLRVPFAGAPNKWTNPGADEKSAAADEKSLRDAALGRMPGGELGPEDLLGMGDQALGEDEELLNAVDFRSERHVQLFRRLQAKWQCFDAYARVCMSLGMRQMLQGVTFFLIGVTMIENCSPSVACSLIVAVQSASALVTSLDVYGTIGLCGNNVDLQIVGILPSVLAFVSILTYPTSETREDDAARMMQISSYSILPAFLLQTCWYQLLLRVSTPTNDDAELPRYWRSVLFMDVFSENVDPTQMDLDTGLKKLTPEEREVVSGLVQAAEHQLARVQSALRRWEAVPTGLVSIETRDRIRRCRKDTLAWTSLLREELTRRRLPSLATPLLQDPPWHAKPAEEWAQDGNDQFVGSLLGPFDQRTDSGATSTFYWDIESGRSLFPGTHDCNESSILTVGEVSGAARGFARSVERVIEAARDRKEFRASEEDASESDGSEASSEDADVHTPLTLARRFSSRYEILRNKNKAPVHVVPERLPWKLLLMSTRVVQLVWVFASVMMFLRYSGIYVIDFQITTLERRRLQQTVIDIDDDAQISLEAIDVSWPFGKFFRPGAMSLCTEEISENAHDLHFLLQGPGAVYDVLSTRSADTAGAASPSADDPLAALHLRHLTFPSFPRGAAPLCAKSEVDASGSVCLVAVPGIGGFELRNGDTPVAFLVDAESSAGAVLLAVMLAPCGQWWALGDFASNWGDEEEEVEEALGNHSCALAVQGMQSESSVALAVARLPLAATSAAGLSVSSQSQRNVPRVHLVRILQVPWAGEPPAAAHVGFGGELWLLGAAGDLERWPPSAEARPLRPSDASRWRLRLPSAGDASFLYSGLCTLTPDRLLIVGRFQGDNPRPGLLRAAVHAAGAVIADGRARVITNK